MTSQRFISIVLLLTYGLDSTALADTRVLPRSAIVGLRGAWAPAPVDPSQGQTATRPEAAPASTPSGPGDPRAACQQALRQGSAPRLATRHTLLWPPHHLEWAYHRALRDVAPSFRATPACESQVTLSLAVFSDEPDTPRAGSGTHAKGKHLKKGDSRLLPDARLAPPSLYLHAERDDKGDGRVYLLIGTATDAEGVKNSVCSTVVVPRKKKKSHIAAVRAQAAAAQAWCDAHDAAPDRFFKLAEGTFSTPNFAPRVDAGPDQTSDLPGSVPLRGTVSDDGRPWGRLTVEWSKVSGPGNITFTPRDAADTATFSVAGTYVLRLTASDGQLSAHDDVQVLVRETNQAPVVDAGPDQSITLPVSTVTLRGKATDDGRPSGTLSTRWSVVGDPSAVTFGAPTEAETTASFSGPGTYVLRLTASDSRLEASDELTVVVAPRTSAGHTWTRTADFAEGQAINVAATSDELQLEDATSAFGFIWVAVSTQGTVVKLDTRTGQVLGEYRTAPRGHALNPSRTTVDHHGNAWIANRDGNSIVHVGLKEAGQCVDRNGNGVIDTSTGLGDVRPWPNTSEADTLGGVSTAADECILHYTRVTSRGTRHVSVNQDNDVWVSGIVDRNFDLVDGETGLIKRHEPSVSFGGYGGLIDSKGVIWSSNRLLRWDTARPLQGPNGINWNGYEHDSYGLCIDPWGNVWETALAGPKTGNPATSGTLRKYAPDGRLLGTFSHGFDRAQGCAVDRTGDVWVAHAWDGSPTVGHVKNDGTFIGNVTVPSGPTGVAVDEAGRIWSSNLSHHTVSRIDPQAGPIGADGVTRVGAVEFTSVDLGGEVYNYSDMTGSTLAAAPLFGTWTAVFDSALATAEWGRIQWTEKTCGDGGLSVTVASSEDGVTFAAPVPVKNGATLGVADGRYLKVVVSFRRATSGESPVLSDLTVGTTGFAVPPLPANASPVVSAGQDQTIETASTTLEGSACDEGLPADDVLQARWTQLSGPGEAVLQDAAQTRTSLRVRPRGSADVALDYSGSSNPNGVWSYGWAPTLKGSMTLGLATLYAGMKGWKRSPEPHPLSHPIVAAPGEGRGVFFFGDPVPPFGVSLPPGMIDMYPGPNGEYAVVRWTAPAAGTYRIEGRFQDIEAQHATVDVAVLRGGTSLASGSLNALGDALPFSLLQTVGAGDSLDFVVGPGPNGNFNRDSTGLRVAITPVDAPEVSGAYVLRLDATDGARSTRDEMTLTVSPPVCVSPQPGLAGWWPGDGNTRDLVSSQPATPAGDLGFGPGMVGQAFLFDGVDDRLSAPGFSSSELPGLTLMAWIRPRQIRFARPLFEFATSSEVGAHFWHSVQPGGSFSDLPGSLFANLIDTNGAWHFFGTGPNAIAPGTWAHVALTYDRATGMGRMYVDGRAVAETRLGSFTPRTSLPLQLGHRPFAPGNLRYFEGGLDEAAVFGRALGAGEIEAVYRAGSLGMCKTINQAPVVDAGPDKETELPTATVTLDAEVTDDGRPGGALLFTWDKVSGPGTVTFGSPTAEDTTATFSAAGTYILQLTASDRDRKASDEVIVKVHPANQPPTVKAGPDQSITTATTTLNGSATDDGLPLGSTLSVSWTRVSGPGPVTFDNPDAAVTTARFVADGEYTLRLSASDGTLSAGDDVHVSVARQNQPPVVDAGTDATITLPVNTVALDGTGTDDGLPEDGTLSFRWSLLSGPAAVTFESPKKEDTLVHFTDPGTYVLRLRANDSRASASDDLRIVVQPAPVTGAPPSVSLTGPKEGERVSSPTMVTGSVRSDSLASWQLEHRLAGDETWTRFATGTTPVTDGSLSTFDPSLLLNGMYEVRLTARDTSGRGASSSVHVVVRDNLKVGHFSVSFVDLEIPMEGLPIRVTRTYDSRDKSQGDFGFGWRLDLSTLRVEENGTGGQGWTGTTSGAGFLSYCLPATRPHLVTVTMANGQVNEFEMVVSPQCQPFVPMDTVTVSYRPLQGTLGSLAPVGDNEAQVVGSWPGNMELYAVSGFSLFDPQAYEYTSPEGQKFLVHEDRGLQRLTDRNGNHLTVTADGITHSSGRSVVFQRNSQGVIESIKDPASKLMTYGYNGEGDLESYTDREQHTTTFTYHEDFPHHLHEINDPLGRTPIRNDYYPDGRIKSHTDAFGKSITYAHDLTHRQEVVTDRNGHVTVLDYDERGNVVKEADPEGKVIKRTFNARNNPKSETVPHDPDTPNPPATLYTYENEGLATETDKVASVTDPEGHVTRYTYNPQGQVLTVQDRRGHFTVNQYDSGNLDSTEVRATRNGRALSRTAYTYWPDGNVKTQRVWTDMLKDLACETRYEYFPEGWLKKEIDPSGHALEYTYDANGNQRTRSTTRTLPSSAPESLVTEYIYDNQGRLTKTIDPDATFTETVYDEMGRVRESYDKRRNKTFYLYDEMGRLFRTTYPDETTEETTWFPEGRRETFKNRRGKVTRYEYDKAGRLRKTIYPDKTFTENIYDAAGQLEIVRDGRGKLTRYEYFKNGQRMATNVQVGGTAADPVFARTRFTYDGNGNLETLTDPKGKTTTYAYDELNRRTSTLFPPAQDGQAPTNAETLYDASGRRIAETDPAGKVTRFGYDCLGRLTSVTQAHDGVAIVATYGYDEVGNRIRQTDANNHTTRFEYDKLGRETKRLLPDDKAETKTYDEAGNLRTRVDFAGRATTFTYDENNRLRLKEYTGGAQPLVSFTYTPNGGRETATDGRGTTNYDYDDRDRLKTLTYPDGRKLDYGWDENGNRTSLSATIGTQTLATRFSYDDANRLDLVTDPVGRTYDHDYDENGNRDSLAHPNGIQTHYTYDNLNRLTRLSTRHAASNTTLQGYSFTLGPVGNRSKITEDDGTVRDYTYDDLYRLTGEKVTLTNAPRYEKAFTYDNVGNRKMQVTRGTGAVGEPTAPGSLGYGYDSRDRLESETGTLAGQPVGVTYGYDDNGNLVSKSADGAMYTWDFENRLTKVSKTDGTLVEYAYDADGNRVQTQTTVAGGSPTTSTFLVDTSGSLSHVVAETDQTGMLKAYYVRGADLLAAMRPLVPIPAAPSDWQTRFYHLDGIDSVRWLTDEHGNATDNYTYSAFGERIGHSGTDSQPYAFAGEPYDPNLGFQYHRARWMDPRAGRFLGMDPFGGRTSDPPSLHRYLYAQADPLIHSDPSGRYTLIEISVAAVLASIAVVGFALLWGGNYLDQGDAETPPDPGGPSVITNYSAVEIADPIATDEEMFDWLASFDGANNTVSTVTGSATGPGSIIKFDVKGYPQADFRVKIKNFSKEEGLISAVTLQGHPVRGYRYWMVWRNGRGINGNNMVVETGGLEEPGRRLLGGLVDWTKARSFDALHLWTEYLDRAVLASGGTEVTDDAFVAGARKGVLGVNRGDILFYAQPRQ